MEALRPLFDHQKLTFMLIAAGVPKKLNQDLVKCDTDEEDSVAYHTILTLFALVLNFYRELSQLMDDCTGRQSAHKLRALKPHPRHFQTFIHRWIYASEIKRLVTDHTIWSKSKGKKFMCYGIYACFLAALPALCLPLVTQSE